MLRYVGDEAAVPAGKRQRTVPIHGWWSARVKARLRELGIDQKQLAAKLKRPEPEVSRCITLKVPGLETVIAISDELTIPYPVILPDSEPAALFLAAQHRLFRRDRQLSEIEAGVAETPTEDQTRTVQSEHAFRQRKRTKARPMAGRDRR